MKNLRTMLLACAMATVVAGAPAAAQTPGASVTGGYTYDGDGPWTLGFDFTASSAWTLSGLGVYDLGGDGLASSHAVGLWDSGGNLLQTATVGAGTSGTLIDGFRYVTFGSLALGAGTYRIGAADLGAGDGYLLDGVVTMASGFSYNSAQFAQGSGLLRPDNTGISGGYFGGNFLSGAVPEPGTWALLILGFGLTGGAMRSARAKKSVTVSFA